MKHTMKITRWMTHQYDYVPTRFEDGVKYGVWEDGKAPLNWRAGTATSLGTYIGQVFRKDPEWSAEVTEWYAADKHGPQDANRLNWHGPFRTRKEATLYLSGLARGFLYGSGGE